MILLDTNILSTFAKIEKLNLLFKIFNQDNLKISPNVLSEIKTADNLGYNHAKAILKLIYSKKIQIISPSNEELIYTLRLPNNFGQGETDSIAIAKSREFIFVTNEKKVINFCKRENILVLSLNSILRSLWEIEILNKKEVKELIDLIELKDNLIITSKKEILEE